VCADWVQRLGRDPDASFEAQPESRSVRIAGVLAPASPRRRAFIPVPTPRRRRPTIPPNCAKSTRKQTREGEKAPRKKPKNRARTNPYIRWSELLRRSYGIDIFTCPHCNGRRRILAFLEDPVVVHKILDHLGLPKEPRAPHTAARRALLSRKQGPQTPQSPQSMSRGEPPLRRGRLKGQFPAPEQAWFRHKCPGECPPGSVRRKLKGAKWLHPPAWTFHP
jgi:hypothetical protein